MMKYFYMKESALNTLPKDTQASLEPLNNLPFQEILQSSTIQGLRHQVYGV